MKKSIKAFVIILSVIAVSITITLIETNRKSPVDRFAEIARTTDNAYGGSAKESFKTIYNKNQTVKYEFRSFELIEDSDIAKQNKYHEEYFYEGHFPDPNYKEEFVDFQSMRRDYPNVDKYLSSNGSKGMTDSEYEEFYEQHVAEYTTNRHPKTKYMFFHCRITNISDGPLEEYINSIVILAMRDGKNVGYAEIGCYFDHPQNTKGEERIHDYCLYRFKDNGDYIECVIGCELKETYVDFSDNNDYYIGIYPIGFDSNNAFNPEIDSNFIKLSLLPRES